MAWTKYQKAIVLLLVITGTLNTLSAKWADRLESKSSDGKVRTFTHPFVQSMSMFMGEMLCLLAFKLLYLYFKKQGEHVVENQHLVKGNRNFNSFIFLIPAMCDMIATSTMYIGLSMTYASSFQMLRGSLIVFVALLSVAFLGRRINIREWIGIFLVIAGLTTVGLSDVYLGQNKDSKNLNDIITGDLLIVAAQIIAAIQIVYEENYVSGLDIPPLQAVGWEGIFGFSMMAILQVPLYYIIVGPPFSNNPTNSLENLPDALVQLKNNFLLILAISGTVLSIAFFNFAGITVTKEISATTRTVLDSLRTVLIWGVSLALGWQAFSFLQVIGFMLLLWGMVLYNDVYVTFFIRKLNDWWVERRSVSLMREVLVNNQADETVTNPK